MAREFHPEGYPPCPSRLTMDHSLPYLDRSNRPLSSQHAPQPPRWIAARPSIPSRVAADLAELDALFGIPPVYSPAQTTQRFYAAPTAYEPAPFPRAHQTRPGHPYLRIRSHIRPPHLDDSVHNLAQPLAPMVRVETAVFPREVVDQQHSRPEDPSSSKRGELSSLPLTTPQGSISQITDEVSGVLSNSSMEDEAVKNLVHELIPDISPQCESKRAAMFSVMRAPWKLNNEIEPEPELLLQFMQKEEKIWKCTLYRGGQRCMECSARKRIQALEHMRYHIDLKPFACTGEPCRASEVGCNKRYCSKDRLRKHRLEKVPCDLCGKEFLPGNLQRHKLETCPNNTH